MGRWTQAMRVRVLAEGRTKWGHDALHYGWRPGCPTTGPHHHCDDFCTVPTEAECKAAGVPYREPDEWDSRATGSSTKAP